jgi:mannose/fructose-specific phosphotransferase system component IIA
LIEAAEEIVGPQPTGVRSVSISSRLSISDIQNRLQAAVQDLRGARPMEGLLVLVDMPGGTPCNIAMRLIKDEPNARVVCGVNLYMLVTAFGQRGRLGLEELTERVISAGRRAIVDMKAVFAAAGN